MRALVFVAVSALSLAPVAAAERSFPVPGFEQLLSTSSADVTVTTGKPVSVVATGDARALDRLDIRVEAGRLVIGSKARPWIRGSLERTRIAIAVPMLRDVAQTGSGDLNIDRVQVRDFGVAASGSGDIHVARADVGALNAAVSGSGRLVLPALTATSARFVVTGSGDVAVAGRAADVAAKVAGSGGLDATGLKADALVAAASGSGSVSVFATGKATLSSSASGSIKLRGGARCTIAKSGSGVVDCG